jgi:uncharacterized protein YndB with AHSA1/START domain
MTLAFSLNRTIEIRARRATVFRFFTDSARWARWWGEGSTIDARPGGKVHIRYPTGGTASGEVRELVADRQIVFTYGYEDPQKPIAPGASLVTITLTDSAAGTRLELRHDVADAATRDQHVPGWRHQLAVFAHVAAADAFAPEVIAAWFAAWADPARLPDAAAANVTFRDAHGCIDGRDELADHIRAALRFMPGVRVEAVGTPRHEQGTVLADWAFVRDGKTLATGTNVFRLDADGKIAECVGISTR